MSQNHVREDRSQGTSPPKFLLLGRSALKYSERFGWAVHPLMPGAKNPASAHGFKDASKDRDQIIDWWTKMPTANIGVATGAVSGVSVLDVDVKDGAGGDLSLRALLEQHGADLTDHVCQRTWSGGLQYVFAYDARAKQGAGCYGKGLDGRNDGGYVVAPPSVVNGATYEWVVKPGSLLAVPEWLFEAAEQTKPRPADGERKNPPGWADELMLRGVPKGERDQEAHRLIQHARETGRSEADCWARLTTFGSNCTPPFDPKTDRDIAGKIRKAYSRPPVFEGNVPAPSLRSSPAAEPRDLVQYEFSDYGNAERLLALYADRIRFSSAIGWLLWDDRRWRAMLHSKKGDHLAVMQLAMQTIRAFKEKCLDITDQKLAARAFKHALQSEGAFRLEAMVELAKSFVRVEMDQLDQDAHLLNVANGTLDLKTGTLRPFEKADYLTRVIPVEYHPGAPAPTWSKFLDTIMGGDADLIGFLQRAVGYSITGLLRDHVLFLLYGAGANGKSTFLSTLHAVLGEYAQGMSPETLMTRKDQGMPNDIARLKGTRLVSALESKRGRQFDESVVKKLTGGDLLTGCFKFKEYFDFLPTHKLWFATNHKPVVKDTTRSIWRRLKLVPFDVAIPEADQDTSLGEKLLAEAPGILAWAVAGCLAWQREGLRPPDRVMVATEQYRQEQDSLVEFVASCLEVAPKAWATIADIYEAYEAWAMEHGGPEHQGEDRLSSRDVSGYLVATYALARGQAKVDGKKAKTLIGIRLREPGTEGTGSQALPGEIDLQETPGTSVPSVPSSPDGMFERWQKARSIAARSGSEGDGDGAPF